MFAKSAVWENLNICYEDAEQGAENVSTAKQAEQISNACATAKLFDLFSEVSGQRTAVQRILSAMDHCDPDAHRRWVGESAEIHVEGSKLHTALAILEAAFDVPIVSPDLIVHLDQSSQSEVILYGIQNPVVCKEFDPDRYSLLLFCQRQNAEKLVKALGSAVDKVNIFMCPKGIFGEKMAAKMQEGFGSVNVSVILDIQNMFRILGELKECENCQEFRLLFSPEMELVV